MKSTRDEAEQEGGREGEEEAEVELKTKNR